MSGKINLVWPLTVYPLAGYSDQGLVDLAVWQTAAGPAYVRALQERATPAIDATYLLEAGTQDTAEVMAIIEWVRRGRNVWIADPVARVYEDLYLGAGDGVRTTFAVPVLAAGYSGLTVYVDGDPAAPKHAVAANLLATDGEAKAEWSSGYLTAARGTGSTDAERIYLPGSAEAAQVTDPTAASSYVLSRPYYSPGSGTPTLPYAAEGETFSMAAVLTPHATNAVQGQLVFEDSTGGYIGGIFPVVLAAAPGQWHILSGNGVVGTGAVGVLVGGEIGNAETGEVTVAALALAPGDLKEWWLPSRAPVAVELSIAPAAGAAVTARVTGQRLYQVVAAREPDVRLDSAGNRTVRISWQGVRP